MSTANKSDLVSNFTGVTGVDEERAKFYLESAAWNLDVALSSFYQEDDDAGVPVSNEEPSNPEPSKSSSNKSKFGTISNLKREDSNSSDEGRQSFYTGGAEHGGGQQILGAKKKKPEDLVQDMFKSAKEHGAEEVPAGTSSDRSRSQGPMFAGTGYKLGETEDSSELIQGAPTASQPRQVDMVLKLWKSGFSVDEGPLRDYQDQQNQEFLNAIKKGEVPSELVRNAHGGEVNLNMEDHREEDYVKPKVVLKAFTGEGNRLGSVTPAAVSTPVSTSQLQQNEAAAKVAVTVNDSQPTTNIQIRLADGSRLVARFNHYHQISDIRAYITVSRPQNATSNFVLMTTFPNKELSDETQTIEQAKLQNAVIVQRFK